MNSAPEIDPRGRQGDRRFRYSILTLVSTVALLGWGAFVTSIDAGLAVPDWPTTMNSYNPFNPWPQWWTATPLLAEHGHRLLAMVVGALTVVLFVWTWMSESRSYVKMCALAALVLVVLQGVLGGLRVVLTSLDLAVVHALVAQLFFCTLAAITLFHSRTWSFGFASSQKASAKIRGLTIFLSTAIYIQIIFGALLRHPGTGIDFFLAITHMVWAFVVACLLVFTYTQIHIHNAQHRVLIVWANVALAILTFQVLLGITAYFVLIDEQGMLVPSNLQVSVNTIHMVTGALLLATSVVMTLIANFAPTGSFERPGSSVVRPVERQATPVAS